MGCARHASMLACKLLDGHSARKVAKKGLGAQVTSDTCSTCFHGEIPSRAVARPRSSGTRDWAGCTKVTLQLTSWGGKLVNPVLDRSKLVRAVLWICMPKAHTVNPVLDSQSCVGQSVLCWTVSPVLDCQSCVGQSILCWTVNPVLDSQSCVGQVQACEGCVVDLPAKGARKRPLCPQPSSGRVSLGVQPQHVRCAE